MAVAVVFPTIQFGMFFPVVFVVAWLLRPPRPGGRSSWSSPATPSTAGGARHYAIAAPRPHGRQPGVRSPLEARGGGAGAPCPPGGSDRQHRRSSIWFKYDGFFAAGLNSFDSGASCRRRWSRSSCPSAISFFTFQAISYVVDTYRGNLGRSRLLDFAAYLSFFPHLVAGPIVRVGEFVPQMERPADPRDIDGRPGLPADHRRPVQEGGRGRAPRERGSSSRSSPHPTTTAPSRSSSASTATPSRSTPTSAATPTSPSASRCCSASASRRTSTRRTSPLTLQDFWRRWHMTLSRWLRDYLYIPLGGNRGSGGPDLPQPHAHHAPRRPVARRGWTFVVWGAHPRRRARRSSASGC